MEPKLKKFESVVGGRTTAQAVNMIEHPEILVVIPAYNSPLCTSKYGISQYSHVLRRVKLDCQVWLGDHPVG